MQFSYMTGLYMLVVNNGYHGYARSMQSIHRIEATERVCWVREGVEMLTRLNSQPHELHSFQLLVLFSNLASSTRHNPIEPLHMLRCSAVMMYLRRTRSFGLKDYMNESRCLNPYLDTTDGRRVTWRDADGSIYIARSIGPVNRM
jgi:hypothetical protein